MNEQNKISKEMESNVLDPKRILNKIIYNWYYFAIAIVLSAITSHYITNNTTPIYSVEGTLLISDTQNSIGIELFSSGAPGIKNIQLQNEIVYLNTYSLALKTIQNLNLNVAYFQKEIIGYKKLFNQNIPIFVEPNWNKNQLANAYFKLSPLSNQHYTLELIEKENAKVFNRKDPDNFKNGLIPIQSIPQKLTASFGQVVRTEYFEFTIYLLEDLSEEIFFSFTDDQSLAKYFKSLIEISPINKDATVLNLKINHPDQQLGQDYINSLMTTFLKNDLEQKNLTTQQTLQFIEKQIVTINDSINIYGNEIQNFRKINQVINISAKGSNILNESVKLSEDFKRQSLRSDYYYYLKTYLENPQSQELLVPSVIGIEDPIINSMVVELISLQNEKVGFSGVLIGDSFSYTRELNNKIENLKRNLSESIDNAIKNIDNQTTRLKSLIGLVERDLNQLPEIEKNLISIERKFKVNESIYTLLLEKRAETEIQKASTTTKHRILDQAMVNPIPISPKRTRNLVLGVSLGFSVPLFILVLWSVFYHKITDPKELEELLDIPIIGTIPREKNITNLLDTSSNTISTESFRNIRSNLSIRFGFKDQGVILVTSTRPGEGKTYTSIKIASIYAALGKRTIILGMDLRKPRLHKELNLKNEKGVTNYLLNESQDWQSLVQQSSQENLEILSAGPYLEGSSELINTQRFETLIMELKRAYDFVVIDTSPIGLVSETLDLTKYSDTNLFLFRQDYSFISQANIANDLRNKYEIKNLYAIINDVHKSGLGAYYGYGYGYSYYSGYDGYKESSKPSGLKKFLSSKKYPFLKMITNRKTNSKKSI